MSILLIHPPVAKPGEPPAGIARLYASLTSAGISCRVLDASLEGLHYLLEMPCTARDTWSARASKHRSRRLTELKQQKTYQNKGRYIRAVKDISRVLEINGAPARITPADYEDTKRSPVRSGDLLYAAEHPEENPLYPYFSGRLSALFNETVYDCAGFSVNFLSQALTAFAMAGFLRMQGYAKNIIFGGGLITSWMRRPGFTNPFSGIADVLIDGPGEEKLIALLGGKKEEQQSCAPDYAALPLDDYYAPVRIIPYSASSGCYWNCCTFCPEKAEGAPYVPVKPEAAAAQVKSLVAKHRGGLVHMLDNALSPAHMAALVKTPPGAPWYGFARVTAQLQDVDFCLTLRASGCVMLQIGIESGDDGVLERMNKGMRSIDASRALHALHKAGIAAYVYLLFGTPYESAASAQKTLAFVVRHHELITFLNLAVFNMPRHETWSASYDLRPFDDADLPLYTDFVHPAGWDRKKVRRFLDRQLKRHPAVRGIIQREPPVFTSNHAPFFCPSFWP